MGLLLNVAAGRARAAARGAVADVERPERRPPRIVIAAGGTAGHVVPAIAVADALRAEGAEVVFVGGERAEARARARRRLPAATRSASRASSRTNPLKAARAVVPGGRARSAPRAGSSRDRRRRRARRRRLRRRAGRPRRAAPGASRSCSPRPTRTSASPTACSRRAPARVCLAFPLDGPRRRPLPSSPAARSRRRRRRPRRRPRRASASRRTRRCVLVFGGSLGARSINQAARRGVRGRRRTASCTSPARATSPT